MRNNVLDLECVTHAQDVDSAATCAWPHDEHIPQDAIDGWVQWAKEHNSCEVHISIKTETFAGVEDPR